MDIKLIVPKEGEIYKIVDVDDHRFELRYGYNEEFERERGHPVVLFPNLQKKPIYTKDGYRIVTSVQEPCEHYSPADRDLLEDWCADCVYYPSVHCEIGICRCEKNSYQSKNVDIDQSEQ